MNVARQVAPAERPREILGFRVSPQLYALVPPLILFLLTLVAVWQYDPLHRPLYRDPGIFAYLSELVAQGLVPHRDGFNEQASLSFFIGGAAMRLGDLFGIHHLLSFRFGAMVVLATVVVLTYVVGTRFTRSRGMGFLAGLILLGFFGLGERAATTVDPKTTMLVFGLAALYFLSRRQWLWAGVCAGAAGLAWQIAWGYLIVALVLAVAQGGSTLKARARALALTVGGALAPLGLYLLYFISQNAHVEMLQQSLVAPGIMHSVTVRTLDWRVGKLIRTFVRGFNAHIPFGVLGGVGLLVWLGVHLQVWRIRTLARRAVYFLLQNRRTAGVLLVTLGYLVNAFLDFQNFPDWFPLLPFISLFAAWAIWVSVTRLLQLAHVSPAVRRAAYVVTALVVLAVSTGHLLAQVGRPPPAITWQDQQRVADELNRTIGPEAPIWMLGKAETLFFMRRINLNRYIYFLGKADDAIEAFDPRGFRGMVDEALSHQPVLYVLSRAKPKKFSQDTNLSYLRATTEQFVLLKRCKAIGAGTFFVRRDVADELFPVGARGCLTRE